MKDLLELLSNTADAVSAVDPEGRVVFWNGAAEALFGLRPQEVLGRFCYEVIAGRDESGRIVCAPLCDSEMTALSQEMVPTKDLLVHTRAGKELWVNVSTIVVPSKWKNLFVLIHLFRDVSLTKEIQRFVQQLVSMGAKLSSSHGTEPSTHPPLPPTSQNLTDREREVLFLLAQGASTKAIAKQLFISPSTVRNHIHNILAKLHVHGRLEAVTLAMRTGLV